MSRHTAGQPGATRGTTAAGPGVPRAAVAAPLRGPTTARSGAALARIAGPPALALAAILLATASRYDLHGDELYFRMLPVAWWYDDQPPLTVWLSRLAAGISDAVWVQRVPGIAAAAAGVVLSAQFPRLLGYGPPVQRVAAWAHAGTVYPLLIGHVFLTSSLDLIAWQAVILLTLAAMLRRPGALAWAGAVAGLACWNKLLVLVLVAALVAALLVTDRALLRTREAALGALALAVVGGPQVAAQVLHGLPMSQVSGDLIARNGELNRWLVLPLLVAFLGPPLAGVWWRGLCWRAPGRSVPVLAVAGALLVGWTLAFPAQPYYPVAAFLPALAIGWGGASDSGAAVWRWATPVVAANAAVSVLLSLPVVPLGSTAYEVVARVNPVARDQAGWVGYVRQLAEARGTADTTVLTDSYALAGAVASYGGAVQLPPDRLASGHNALWDLGPPTTDAVLLVGPIAVSHRRYFRACEDAGTLQKTQSDPFGVAGEPLARCTGVIPDWATVWPHFRRLGA